MPTSAYYASQLRHELRERNLAYAEKYRLPHRLSYGGAPVVCYEPKGFRHGNFLPETYECILEIPAWAQRLKKAHTAKGTHLPRNDRNFWAELDTCTSSDALLMNVFCHPGAFEDGRLAALLGINSASPATAAWDDGIMPEFGFKSRVPLADEHFDRTEVDMRVVDLLVEAKLTEADFQSREREFVHAYRDFAEVFDCEELPQTRDCYLGYQLIRNVLGAHALDCSFCVLHDERRPDLREAWYAVMRCVRSHELRTRCKVLTWQELAGIVPERLSKFLDEKYGIAAHE